MYTLFMFWALIVKFELLTCFINVVVTGGNNGLRPQHGQSHCLKQLLCRRGAGLLLSAKQICQGNKMPIRWIQFLSL